VIHGLESAAALPGITVFHSGTAKRDSDIVTAGGRVLTVVASGDDYRSAIGRAYQAVGTIQFDGMHFRKDIGAKALVQADEWGPARSKK
jgi:phosphoribosylamine--glycine ligase